jgi:alanine dehydrogenase
VTAPFVFEIADKGAVCALTENHHLCEGLNVHNGMITHKAVADALGLSYVPASEALKR